MVATNKGLFSGVNNLLSAEAKSRDGRAIAPVVSILKKALSPCPSEKNVADLRRRGASIEKLEKGN